MQHESAFLWKFHSKHHAIDTPTPFSTLFIHPVDALLQVCLCDTNSSGPTTDPKHHTPAAQSLTPHTRCLVCQLQLPCPHTPSQPWSCTVLHTSTPQGSLPLAFAALLVRPAPAVLYLFFAARLGENAVNHSGLDSQLVDVLTLKVIKADGGPGSDWSSSRKCGCVSNQSN